MIKATSTKHLRRLQHALEQHDGRDSVEDILATVALKGQDTLNNFIVAYLFQQIVSNINTTDVTRQVVSYTLREQVSILNESYPFNTQLVLEQLNTVLTTYYQIMIPNFTNDRLLDTYTSYNKFIQLLGELHQTVDEQASPTDKDLTRCWYSLIDLAGVPNSEQE